MRKWSLPHAGVKLELTGSLCFYLRFYLTRLSVLQRSYLTSHLSQTWWQGGSERSDWLKLCRHYSYNFSYSWALHWIVGISSKKPKTSWTEWIQLVVSKWPKDHQLRMTPLLSPLNPKMWCQWFTFLDFKYHVIKSSGDFHLSSLSGLKVKKGSDILYIWYNYLFFILTFLTKTRSFVQGQSFLDLLMSLYSFCAVLPEGTQFMTFRNCFFVLVIGVQITFYLLWPI